MPDPLTGQLDPARILFDLQQGNEIAQSLSGCLEPEEIARRITNGLVEKFNCAFARLWLLDPEQSILKLVASSGMYTRTDGFFGRVPMGAYKVGKIAQNRVSFLSNNLAAESWVGNREWAIANNIRGFAGYPLAIKDRVIGVLATFSHHVMEPEFLEVLQSLCTLATIALDTGLQYQKEKQIWQSSIQNSTFSYLSLSDQIASILSSTRLTLVGTEQPLPLSMAYLFLRTAELLDRLNCAYCRLSYTDASVAFEAILSIPDPAQSNLEDWMQSQLGQIPFMVSYLGGVLQTQASANQRSIQVVLQVPYALDRPVERLRIQCRLPLLQLAFTHLASLAGLEVCHDQPDTPLLTDDLAQVRSSQQAIWIQQGNQTPKRVRAIVDLSSSPDQLRQAVAAVQRGELWGVEAESEPSQILSERELEILNLLTQGHRDRDIADRLVISESTVKFHLNNVLAKLKARTRYQAIREAIVNGWI